MSGWVRFENTMPDSPKVDRVGHRAFRVWVYAACQSSRGENDGFISERHVQRLVSGQTRRDVRELVNAGLLDETDGGYLVHDYLNYNPSKEKLGAMRDAVKRRVSKHRSNAPVTPLQEGDVTPLQALDVTPLQERYPRGRDRSVPERVVVSSLDSASNPPPSQDKNNQVQGQTARGRETVRPSSDVVALCNRLAALISLNDPKSDPQPRDKRWLTDMRLLLADRDGDIEEVRAVIEWCQRDSFWRSNILSPGKLRKRFTQLKLRMDGDDNGGQGGARRRPTPRPESPSEMLIALNGGQI